jgi:hypothetical protein
MRPQSHRRRRASASPTPRPPPADTPMACRRSGSTSCQLTAVAGPANSGLIRSGLIRSGLIRSGLIRSGLIRSGLIRSGLIRSGPLLSGPMAGGLIPSGRTDPGLVHRAPPARSRRRSTRPACDQLAPTAEPPRTPTLRSPTASRARRTRRRMAKCTDTVIRPVPPTTRGDRTAPGTTPGMPATVPPTGTGALVIRTRPLTATRLRTTRGEMPGA